MAEQPHFGFTRHGWSDLMTSSEEVSAVNLDLGATAVTLGPKGAGVTRVGPASGEKWHPASVKVRTDQSADDITSEAQCLVFVGPPDDMYYVGGTISGSSGDSDTEPDLPEEIGYGEYIWAIWVLGDAGSQGYLEVSGIRTPAV